MLLPILFFLFIMFAVIVMSLLDRHISLIMSILLGDKTRLKQDIVESNMCSNNVLTYNPSEDSEKFEYSEKTSFFNNAVDK